MNIKNSQKRAVIFMRARWPGKASQDREIEERQFALQRQMCGAAAEQLGAKIIREYSEHGGRGALDKRPMLRQMLDELLALRDAEYVICTSLDRLVRTARDMQAIQLELEAAGVDLVVANTAHLPKMERERHRVVSVAVAALMER